MAGQHPGTLQDAPDRIVNLAKNPAYLAKKRVVSEKKKSLGYDATNFDNLCNSICSGLIIWL